MRRPALALLCATLGCASGGASGSSSAAPAASPAAPATSPVVSRQDTVRDVMVATRVGVGGSFSPHTGEAALRAFVPDVTLADSTGECSLLRTGGSGATTVLAYFPTRTAARMQVNLTFDSAGHLARYNERRGVPHIPSTRGMTDAQRDSTIQAVENSVRSTTISLDYAIDQGIAMNRGGGRPTNAILGTVRALESLEQLGPPRKTLERVRRLCGV